MNDHLQPLKVVYCEKGKRQDLYISINTASQAHSIEFTDGQSSRQRKDPISLKLAYAEVCQNSGDRVILITTNEKEVTLTFEKREDCLAWYRYIIGHSDVHFENSALNRLDEEMLLIWPLSRNSFF